MTVSDQDPYEPPPEDAPPVISAPKTTTKLIWVGIGMVVFGCIASEFFDSSAIAIVGAIIAITAFGVWHYRNQ